MILSKKKRITNALVSLRGCAGWSAPLLFATPEDRFSHVEAHIKVVHNLLFKCISLVNWKWPVYAGSYGHWGCWFQARQGVDCCWFLDAYAKSATTNQFVARHVTGHAVFIGMCQNAWQFRFMSYKIQRTLPSYVEWDFPLLSNGPVHFQIKVFRWICFHFYSILNRTSCKQTVETLIRCRGSGSPLFTGVARTLKKWRTSKVDY